MGAGAVVVLLGYECVPNGQSLAPDNFTFFAKSADAGMFMLSGVHKIIAGLCIFIIGLLLPLKW